MEPIKPSCYKDRSHYDASRRLCYSCPWFYICGSHVEEFPNIERKDFIQHALREGIPPYDPELLSALRSCYGISHKAARMAVRYQLKVRSTKLGEDT